MTKLDPTPAPTLAISTEYQLPLDVVTNAVGIVAVRGSGKTYLTCVMVEEMLDKSITVCVFDPIGVYSGFRSSAEGDKPGLPILILGGDHGDLPLHHSKGVEVAEWMVRERRSCVFDMSHFRKGEQRQFVTDFAETIYRKNKEPLHLILDEADLFIPQQFRGDEARMVGAFEDIVRRGRARGIGCSLVTQRPAVINKDVLTQVSVLVVLRMGGPQDRKAVEDWIKYHGTPQQQHQVLSSLAALPIGTAWLCSPGWLGILKKVRVRKRRTFDSSATPKVGEKRIVPTGRAEVDLRGLGFLTDVEDESEVVAGKKGKRQKSSVEDIATISRLNQRIAELEDALTVREQGTPKFDPEVVGDLTSQVRNLTDTAENLLKVATGFAHATGVGDVEHFSVVKNSRITKEIADRSTMLPIQAATVAAFQREEESKQRPTLRTIQGGKPYLGKCERAVLTAVVQRHPATTTAIQASVISTYSAKSSSFVNALSALRTGEYLTGDRHGMTATRKGLSTVGQVPPWPRGKELFSLWTTKLDKAERIILEVLIARPNMEMTKQDISERSGYSTNSSSFVNALSKLRTLGLLVGKAKMRCSEEFR